MQVRGKEYKFWKGPERQWVIKAAVKDWMRKNTYSHPQALWLKDRLGGTSMARINSSELRTTWPRGYTAFFSAYVYNGAPSPPLNTMKRAYDKRLLCLVGSACCHTLERQAIWKQTTCGSIPRCSSLLLRHKPALFSKLKASLTLLSQRFPFKREGWDEKGRFPNKLQWAG